MSLNLVGEKFVNKKILIRRYFSPCDLWEYRDDKNFSRAATGVMTKL